MTAQLRRRIDLVVSDIDGTFTRQDKTVSRGNVAAVRRLIDAGVQFTLISARPPAGIAWIADRLELDCPLGAFNGGTIFLRDGTVLETHRVPRAVAARTLALIDRPAVIPWVFAGGVWHTRETDELHTPRKIKSAGQEPTMVDGFDDLLDTVDKIVAVCDDDPLLDGIERDVAAAIGGEATVGRSQTYYLDITASRANKGDGIATLARVIGVPLESTAALGDQHNDLAMFERVPLAVAMGQAPLAVQSAADEVSRSNDDDGVAHAIDRFILRANR